MVRLVPTEHMQDRLPDYACPSRFEPVETLPLNHNGKVDRRALLARIESAKPDSAEVKAPKADHDIAGLISGFLIGGIPFGYLLGRSLLKDDIRNHGSGNIGATNVARVIGWKWGAVVLVLDALKGMLPTLAAVAWARQNQPQLQYHLAVATGISAIVGHMYPVYLRLRGGKGVATALGVVLVLGPKAVLAAFIVFAAIAFTTRLIGLASMLAALTYGGCQLYLLQGVWLTSDKWSLTLFSVAIPLLIVWRHRSNIMRMIRGTEPPISESARPQDANNNKTPAPAEPPESDGDATA